MFYSNTSTGSYLDKGLLIVTSLDKGSLIVWTTLGSHILQTYHLWIFYEDT